MGRATSNFFFAPPPGALGRGQKVKYHLISITKSISKIFIPNFVCVLTQMKDTKHIRRYFHSVPRVMPQGWDFGALGVPRGSKKNFFFKHGHVEYQIDGRLCIYFCRPLFFFKTNFFKKFFQEYHQGVKQFGSRSSPRFCLLGLIGVQRFQQTINVVCCSCGWRFYR